MILQRHEPNFIYYLHELYSLDGLNTLISSKIFHCHLTGHTFCFCYQYLPLSHRLIWDRNGIRYYNSVFQSVRYTNYHCVVISRGSSACVRLAPWRWRHLVATSHCTSVPTVWTLGCLRLWTLLWISALCVGKTKWERYNFLGYGTVQSCRWVPTFLWNVLLPFSGFSKFTLKMYMTYFFEVSVCNCLPNYTVS
jgi:hypothetical protein